MRSLSLFLLLLWCLPVTAQLENHLWYYGTGGYGIQFDFTTKQPSVISPKLWPYSNEGSSVIVNPVTGALLCYTDGIKVVDATHWIMPNGNGLNGEYSSSQSGWACRVPGNCNRYYVISTNAASEFSPVGTLYYSIVDMSLPGNGTVSAPLGDVVPGYKNITFYPRASEALCIVPSADPDKLWLLSVEYPSLIRIFSITTSGITYVSTYNTNITVRDPRNIVYSAAAGKFSLTGCVTNDPVLVADFNAQTGVITNPFTVPGTPPTTVYTLYRGIYDSEWSPDGTKLYYGYYRWHTTDSGGRLYQYDLTTNTNTLLYDVGSVPGKINYTVRGMKLGPDGKIYVQYSNINYSPPSDRYLGVINDPDAAGTACNFDPLGFDIGFNYPAAKFPEYIPHIRPDIQAEEDVASISCTTASVDIHVEANDHFSGAVILSEVLTQHGSVTVNNDHFIYTPESGFLGNDTVFYKICAATTCFPLCDESYVVITISAPAALNAQEDAIVVSCLKEPVTIDVVSNDLNPDQADITLSVVSTVHGSASTHNGQLIYNPDADYNGADTIYYSICNTDCILSCDESYVLVDIPATPDIFIPNLITRNKDGKNDFFIPTGLCIPGSLHIYNRWGHCVYVNEAYQNDWNGEGLTDGLYYYHFLDPVKDKEYKGWVQLIE